MSHPRKLKLFRKWARAMEEGSTVDQPDYGKSAKGSSSGKRPQTRKRRRKRRRRLQRRRREES